jgi:hypothetical protein
LFEVGKFAKKPYFRGFAVVPKEPHPAPFYATVDYVLPIVDSLTLVWHSPRACY